MTMHPQWSSIVIIIGIIGFAVLAILYGYVETLSGYVNTVTATLGIPWNTIESQNASFRGEVKPFKGSGPELLSSGGTLSGYVNTVTTTRGIPWNTIESQNAFFRGEAKPFNGSGPELLSIGGGTSTLPAIPAPSYNVTPHVLHFVHVSPKLSGPEASIPAALEERLKDWSSINRGWTVTLWRDSKVLCEVPSHLPRQPAQRTDCARLPCSTTLCCRFGSTFQNFCPSWSASPCLHGRRMCCDTTSWPSMGVFTSTQTWWRSSPLNPSWTRTAPLACASTA